MRGKFLKDIRPNVGRCSFGFPVRRPCTPWCDTQLPRGANCLSVVFGQGLPQKTDGAHPKEGCPEAPEAQEQEASPTQAGACHQIKRGVCWGPKGALPDVVGFPQKSAYPLGVGVAAKPRRPDTQNARLQTRLLASPTYGKVGPSWLGGGRWGDETGAFGRKENYPGCFLL